MLLKATVSLSVEYFVDLTVIVAQLVKKLTLTFGAQRVITYAQGH